MIKNNIAFLGLGTMGFPMAGHLLKANYNINVYNRTNNKALKWQQSYQGGTVYKNIKELCKNSKYIITCLGNDDDLKEVFYKPNGIFSGIQENSIIIDHTSTTAEISKELYNEAKKLKCDFIDAPVTGGQAGAQNGTLAIMVGGDKDIFNKIQKIIKVYASYIAYIGKSGSGQIAKMANQICIAGLLQGLAEGINFIKKSNIDKEATMSILTKGAASSWQMINRYKTMFNNEYDFGFAVKWMRKDLNNALITAKKLNTQLPITALVDQLYAQVESQGGKNYDTSSLLLNLLDNHKNK